MYKYYFTNQLEEIKSNLATRGFSVVTLTDDLSLLANECYQEMNEFFNLNKYDKEEYFREPVFGWFEVPHKQVFRVATGNKMDHYAYPSLTLKSLIPYMDKMMQELVLELFPGADKITKITFDYGLLDVVKYNNNLKRKDNLNIVEHYDAGLLAFNFFDNMHGLQFKNEFGEWIDIINDNVKKGVIWTGHSVRSYSELHPEGIHRVLTNKTPRFSMWYEIACFEQMRDDIKNNEYVGYDYEIQLMEKEGYKVIKENDKIIGYEKNNQLESGWRALEKNITGSNNKHIGWKTMESITTGSNKVAIGSNTNINVILSKDYLSKTIVKKGMGK